MRTLLCLPLLAGCSSTLMFTAKAPSAGPPQIERLVDLGGLPPVTTGPLSTDQSDAHFLPGEFVAVMGKNLHDAAIAIDGAPVPTHAYLDDGSVLIRLPAALAPGKQHRLSAGNAEKVFGSELLVVASDTDGNRLRFLRLGSSTKKKQVADPELELKQTRALHHAVSADRALLYSVGLQQKEKAGDDITYVAELQVVHLAAKKKPSSLGKQTVKMKAHPSGIFVTPGGELLLLGTREVVLLSLANPLAPVEKKRVFLSEDKTDRYIDAAFLGGYAYLLEAGDNRITALSLADLSVTAQLLVGPAENVPYSVDLVVDPQDPTGFMVVQGLNLRLGSKRVGEGRDAVFGFLKKGYDAVLGKEGGADKTEGDDVEVPKRGRMVRVDAAEGRMTAKAPIPLPPDFLPLFAVSHEGSYLISGVAPGALETSTLDASFDGAGKVLSFLKDSVQCGKIARVEKDGSAQMLVQGVSVFFDLGLLPDGKLVYSGMRLSGRLSPPFVGVSWGVGLQDGLFYSLHNLEYDYFIPPYTYGQVSVQ